MLHPPRFSLDADFCLLAGGGVTNSQLFTFNGGSGPLSFQPENAAGSCLTVKGNVLDVAQCNSGDTNQSFTFGGAAAAGGNASDNGAANGTATAAPTDTTGAVSATGTATTSSAKDIGASTDTANGSGSREATSAPSASVTEETGSVTQGSAPPTETASSGPGSAGETTDAGAAIPNPTSAVPVSRAGGTLNPSAVAESQQRDDTATRAFSGAGIRAPNGQCLFVDPTAGDFRENLIPIALVDCGGTPNEKWDVITAGKHNNAKDSALIVSSLVRSGHGLC